MSDPRTTVTHGTLVGLTSTPLDEALTSFPITKTDPNLPKTVNNGYGLGVVVSQDPTVEGQMIIYSSKFGKDRVAEVYVAVEIGGTLEWVQAILNTETQVE